MSGTPQTTSAGVAAELASAAPSMAPARKRGGQRFIGLILPLLLLLVWEALVAAGLVTARLFPPPSVLAQELAGLAASGELLAHVLATLARVAAGFALGAAAGTLIGAVTGMWPLAFRLLDSSVQALRAVPSIAWVPLFILWFGIFETSKVLLIAVGVFFPVYLALSEAIRQTDRKLVEVGQVFGMPKTMLIFRVMIPAALPAWLVSLRSGLGLGWMFVVAAEFMGASQGLGYLLVDGQMAGRPQLVLSAILVFAVLGKLSDAALAAVSAYLLRWQDAYKPGGER